MKSVIVVGGGFKGIMGAYLMRQRGYEVTLVERSAVLGGIMYSAKWNDFYVDNGVHLFDSIPKNLAAIIEDVMDGNVFPIDFNYASVYNDITTDGLAIPDFENLELSVRQKILYEVTQCLTSEPKEKHTSAFDKMKSLYGPTASALMSESMAHIYGVSADKVEADSLRQTAYHRIKFLPDDMALALKVHPVLDDRIAAKRVAVGKVDDFVSIYPGKHGMRGFCEQMTHRLEAMGVTLILGKEILGINLEPGKPCELKLDSGNIQSDLLFWGNDYALLANMWRTDARIDKATHKTPMVVYYFRVKQDQINNYTYFHQFTPSRHVFRSSAAGLYSKQSDLNGESFVSVECPTIIGNDMWLNPSKYQQEVWNECVNMGLVAQGSNFIDEPLIRKAPVTHRFPLVGCLDLCQELDHEIHKLDGALIVPKNEAFTRREIMFAVEEAIAEL